jgi:hypothetical protein
MQGPWGRAVDADDLDLAPGAGVGERDARHDAGGGHHRVARARDRGARDRSITSSVRFTTATPAARTLR